MRNQNGSTFIGIVLGLTLGIGVAVGLDMFIIAVIGACALYFLLSLHHQKWYIKWKQNMIKKHGKENEND